MNDVGIDFVRFLHQSLEDVSPNVPSFFATYFGKNLLHSFIVFVAFPLFSANPRRHAFYWGVRMVFVHAPFSENSMFHEKQFGKLWKCRTVFASTFFDFHDSFGIDYVSILDNY